MGYIVQNIAEYMANKGVARNCKFVAKFVMDESR